MAGDDRQAPVLVLGPLLRYVDETAATIWVETDRACQVEILGHQARTFQVDGHHYALVVIDDLQPGGEYEYQVALDGTVRWPEPGSAPEPGPGPVFPPSVLRTLDPDKPQRLLFGSCRTTEQEHGADALAACALGLRQVPRENWPGVLLLIGDQVYADGVGPATRSFIEGRRDPSSPPGYEVADFTEYCELYREAWGEGEPWVRWLLSIIPTMMIFDDHDVHDDWNISGSWRLDFQAKPWWRSRIIGAYMSYWIYQHLGNLSPAELENDELWRRVREQDDAAAVLSDFAARADQRTEGIRFSVLRDFGGVRVVVIDSRSRRVVADDGKRLMVDEAEWEWVTRSASADCDHLVLVSSLPVLLPRGIHALEAWSEAVCDRAWGKHFARFGERVRRAIDLEHWAAFGKSFAEFERLLTDLATGSRGKPPASITVVGGDVHHNYLAPVKFPPGVNPRSLVYQAVCSPIHNTLPNSFRRGYQLATSRAGEVLGTAVARLAGVREPRIRWRITHGPWFSNMVSALEFERGKARIRFDHATTDPDGKPVLQLVCEAELVRETGETGETKLR